MIGDIVAVNAEVVGRITGNVMVAEMLVLKATSSLEGDIQARNRQADSCRLYGS